jgi:YgiT-type zinc finger domain-containing protein
MRCLICKHQTIRPGTTTVTLERDGLTLVVKNVPAQVCPNCGEAYVDEKTAADLLKTAEQMARGCTGRCSSVRTGVAGDTQNEHGEIAQRQHQRHLQSFGGGWAR